MKNILTSSGWSARWMAVLLLVAMAVTPLAAQTGTSSLAGTVTDASGAVVPGAKVTLSNTATGYTRTQETDGNGLYAFTSVPPGKYTLTIGKDGFKESVAKDVELLVNVRGTHNASLSIGGGQEVVEVRSEAVAVNTTDASLGNAITQDQVQSLPLEARNIPQLLSLQPGATFVPRTQAADPRQGSVNGSRGDQSNVTLDGVDVNDTQTGQAYHSALRVTPDSVQEFRVTTSNYGAEFGRSSAGQVAIVTRTGTNDFHGSAFWLHRNTAWSSNEYFNKLTQLENNRKNKPQLLQKHLFGGTIGGPILKDRFHFFYNAESQRFKSGQSATRNVPSSSLRDGVLIYQCRTASSCPGGTVAGFSGSHTVPAGYFGLTPSQLAAIDPLGIGPSVAASQYFKRFPNPNGPGRDIYNIAGFQFEAPVLEVYWTHIARLDFKVDEAGKHTLFWRGSLQDDLTPEMPQYPGLPPNRTTLNNSKGFAIGYTSLLSSRLVNNFRYGFTRIDVERAGTLNSNLALFRFIDDLTEAFSSNGRAPLTHTFANDTTFTAGRHTWQWGTNIRLLRNLNFTNGSSFHFATANGSWVSGVGRRYIPGRSTCTTPGCSAVPAAATGFFASYADSFINILGILSQATANYNYDREGRALPSGEPSVRDFAANDYEFYLQDTFKLRPNLTVTLGVRYSLAPAPWERNGLQVAPTLSMGDFLKQRGQLAASGNPDNRMPLVTFDLAGRANDRPDWYRIDKNDWAPRIAVAYSPGFDSGLLGALTGGPGKMSIRAGYGLVYDKIGNALVSQFDAVGAFGLSTSLSSPFGVNNENTPGIRFVNTTTLPASLPAAPPGGFPTTPPVGAGVITSSIDANLKTPYSHTYNLAIGRELPANMLVEAAYVGRKGRNLLVRRDFAMPLNLVDRTSGMDYFTAATLAIKEAEARGLSSNPAAYATMAPIAYWENLFPGAANYSGTGLTASQEMALYFASTYPDHITTLWAADQFCDPSCSIFGPFAYFNQQYDSLAGQSTIGYSNYDALQLTLRRRMTGGLQFDFNYTLAKSFDIGSALERGSSFTSFSNGGYTGFLLNSWDPDSHYGPSDFDLRHQINANWVVDVPFGRGRKWAADAPAIVDAIVGGWQLTGIARWNSGFPMSVYNCRSCWATNWNLQGNAGLLPGKTLPPTGTTTANIGTNSLGNPILRPSPFKDRVGALDSFRRVYPGEVGIRNRMRGDGYVTADMGINKWFNMPVEGHRLKFSWEVFNLTNTARFDVGSMNMFPDIRSTFGTYTQTLSSCDGVAGRCMQVGVRYQF